ncbi:MAG: thioredoxin domain-containing protein [Chloroflexi bacterium]|nr:thioredoxin domain-containing protein [Chloroflexota bacterium]
MLETEPKLKESYVKTGRVKLVFRHILDFGEPSLFASQAAECAGDQGAFWAMHGLLYQRQDAVWTADAALFKGWAKDDLHIDADAFAGCLTSSKYKSKVEAQYAAARASGVRIRPTFDINGKRVQGAISFDEFRKILDALP